MRKQTHRQKKALWSGRLYQVGAPAPTSTIPPINTAGILDSAQLATDGLNIARSNLGLTTGLQLGNAADAIRQGMVQYAIGNSTGAIAALNAGATVPPANFNLTA
jgi:hypothetical protein